MIICRTAPMRSGSKNMCSVRHRPMPSAPNLRAVSASSGVSALARTPMRRRLVGPFHQRAEIAGHRRLDHRDGADEHLAGRAVQRDGLAGADRLAAGRQRLGVVVDRDAAGAGDAGPAHAARHHRGVAGHAAARGQDAAGGVHAVDVLGAGLDAHQDDRLALRRAALRLVGAEHDRAATRRPGWPAGPCASSVRGAFGSSVGCSNWSSEDGLTRRTASASSIRPSRAISTAMRRRRRGGAFAVAGLQHVQLVLLHGELDVLHVVVVLFELLAHRHQFGVGLRHRRFQRHLARLGARPWTAAAACGCRPPRPRPARSPDTRRRTCSRRSTGRG